EPVAREALAPLAATGLGAGAPPPEDFGYAMNTDGQSFFVAGVPSFVVAQNLADYLENHHRATDTADKLFALDLAYDAAVLALASGQLANHDGPIGRPRAPAEVRAAVDRAHQAQSLSPGAKAFLR